MVAGGGKETSLSTLFSPLCSLNCWVGPATFISVSNRSLFAQGNKKDVFLKIQKLFSNKVSILKLLCFPFLYYYYVIQCWSEVTTTGM